MKGREKKSIIKKWWFWLIVVIAIGCVYTASQPKNQANETTKSASDAKSSEQPTQADNKQEKKKDRLTLDDGWQVDKSNPYITKVTGVVSNNSDKAINGYIQIIFLRWMRAVRTLEIVSQTQTRLMQTVNGNLKQCVLVMELKQYASNRSLDSSCQ